MLKELYFCIKDTEPLHRLHASSIRRICEKYKCHLAYYRKLSGGHIPGYMELEIVGNDKDITDLHLELIDSGFIYQTTDNPHHSH